MNSKDRGSVGGEDSEKERQKRDENDVSGVGKRRPTSTGVSLQLLFIELRANARKG